jgi:hypothetical protein
MPQLVVAEPFSFQLRLALEQIPQHLIGVGDHGAELEAFEDAAITTYAAVAVDDRPIAFATHEDGDGEHQWREHEPKRQRPCDVESAFQPVIDGPGTWRRCPTAEHGRGGCTLIEHTQTGAELEQGFSSALHLRMSTPLTTGDEMRTHVCRACSYGSCEA